MRVIYLVIGRRGQVAPVWLLAGLEAIIIPSEPLLIATSERAGSCVSGILSNMPSPAPMTIVVWCRLIAGGPKAWIPRLGPHVRSPRRSFYITVPPDTTLERRQMHA
jgi:hypothetical protein